MKVLVTCAAGIGHVHPLMPLSRALLARGHDVRFAVAAEHCAAVEQAGIPAVQAGILGAQRAAAFTAEWGAECDRLAPSDRPDFMFPRSFGAIAMPQMVADVRRVVADWRPDLIVHDAAELAAPLIAAELGVRRAAHSFGTVTPPQRLASAAEMTAHLWAEAGVAQPPYAGVYEDVYVDIRPPSLADVPAGSPHVLHERPTAADAIGGDLPPFVTAPDDRPLVYLTLGTVFTSPAVMRTAIAGIATLPVRLLLTVGPRVDPGEIGAVADHVHVTRYVPQTELLAHCAVVVSHAGSGTFLAALAQGLPQLCLPQGADQYTNAADGARAGAAIMLSAAEATPDAIGAAVSKLLSAPSYLAGARRLAAEIAQMPTADDVAAALEATTPSAQA
ncbi:MAG TPA: glycosyltransferase [Mycobacteriales bacterium]|nr:glycosyltransferase [Mycobacteriales bacterium]